MGYKVWKIQGITFRNSNSPTAFNASTRVPTGSSLPGTCNCFRLVFVDTRYYQYTRPTDWRNSLIISSLVVVSVSEAAWKFPRNGSPCHSQVGNRDSFAWDERMNGRVMLNDLDWRDGGTRRRKRIVNMKEIQKNCVDCEQCRPQEEKRRLDDEEERVNEPGKCQC